VGNLQLKDGGVWNGTIDSAGSEWIWEGETFSHIGRHTYHRQNLPVPMRPENAPSEILQVAEREMVTGCCQAIPTSLFREIGGYNPNYRIGYWEDSELCMTVKELGYKIMFQPNSLIFHKLGHTGSGGHKFQSHNRDYFFNKWVNSGRIDKLVGSPRPRSFHINTVYLKRTGANGDVLVAAAVASALKEKYNCQIIFCTGCPDVLKGNPHINKIIQDQNIKAREHQIFYDLDMVYEYRPYTNILDAYAQAVGVSKEKCKLHLSISRPKVQLPNDYVVIHPGRTMWAGRDWKQENFAEIAKRLTDQGLQVVLVGNGDYPIVNAMDLRNQTTIAELAYTIKNSKLFIGIDSFPMHVAQTFDVPGVCFFGSVNPDTRILSTKMHGITAKSLPCLGCHHRKPTPCTVTNICQIGHQDCIDQVTVDDMYQKINEILVNI
jgi:ADP-heptose:LPS heptosyltransferase